MERVEIILQVNVENFYALNSNILFITGKFIKYNEVSIVKFINTYY